MTREHKNLSRNGLYIDPAFTVANAANLSRDLNFDGTIEGSVVGQGFAFVPDTLKIHVDDTVR